MTISNQNNWPLVNYRDAQGRGFPCACRTHYLRQAKNNGSKQQMKPNREHKNTSRQKIQKPHTHKIHSSPELKNQNQTVLLFKYFTRFRECTAVRLQYGLSVLTWSGALDSWRQTDSWFSVSVCDSVLVPICIQHLCLRKESTEWIPNMSPELWNTFHINRSRFIIILNHKSNVYNTTLPFSKLTQSMQVWAFLNMYK